VTREDPRIDQIARLIVHARRMAAKRDRDMLPPRLGDEPHPEHDERVLGSFDTTRLPPISDAEVREYLLAAARVPLSFVLLACDREALSLTTASAAANEALSATRPMLVLSGPAGVGKTVAAVQWVRAWVAARCGSALFVTALDITTADVRGGALRAWCDTGALVLDDLGREYLDDRGWLLSLVEGVLDARYAARRPTIITTNLARDLFKARYGERIVDRLREAGTFIEVVGPSLRAAR